MHDKQYNGIPFVNSYNTLVYKDYKCDTEMPDHKYEGENRFYKEGGETVQG